MIAADVNLLVYLFVPGPHTAVAAQSLVRDPVWVVPPVYAYEVLNVMATHVRKGEFDVAHALQVVRQIEVQDAVVSIEDFAAGK